MPVLSADRRTPARIQLARPRGRRGSRGMTAHPQTTAQTCQKQTPEAAPCSALAAFSDFLSRALSTPTPAARHQTAIGAPCPTTATACIKAAADRHLVRSLGDRSLHTAAAGDPAVDSDVRVWDRRIAVSDLHLIARARRARAILGDRSDRPQSVELVWYSNLPARGLRRR